ncbi:MAG: hypothetical protein NVV59_11905 [Chitinophagaceae bacterium]|nr:hypothetical protein [Chitinophagaceae bacterium]
MADFPNVGNSYIIELCFPVKLNLSTPFWALYMNPTAATEGLDSEAGIQSLRFCLCKAKSIISQNEKDARLEVEVSEVKSLTSLIGSAPGTAARVPDIIKDTAAGYGSIEHFENYCLVRVDFQGDCGTQSIFWKNNGRSYLVAENDWDFHRDTWELLNEPLSREQELTLGISHSPQR